ncbi:MAG: sulfatase-like hydrolase/transferase [Gemmataceae bacterium]|nr:sulfatase-like hydrolase/transferase [Gemmataceae bacterium]
MRTTLALLALVLAPAGTAHASGDSRPARPNILLIVADDLGYADLGIHGGKAAPTPHLDKLARAGVRCTSGYVSAPYCSPSRAGLLTGRYQTRFGHEFNPHVGPAERLGLPLEQRTLADLLRAAGYATGLVGKWHLGFSKAHHPQSRGFDEFFGFLVGAHNFILRKDAEPKFASAMSRNLIYRGREIQHMDGFTTEVFTNEAIGFMKRHRDRPWFLYLSYNAVHTPLEITPAMKDRIPADVKDPARRGYLALLLGLDDAIGRLVSHLREAGVDRDTLVIFVSDNGGSGLAPFLAYNTGNNWPLRGNKGQTLEGGIRVPFVLVWSGKLPAGKTYDHPVITLDLLPTACAVAGAKTPANADGVNLVPYLLGTNKAVPHDALYWRFGPQKAVRKGDWALVDWRDFEKKTSSGWQLFDLAKDIGQQHDVAAQHPAVAAGLRAAWERWNGKNIPPLWHGSPTEDPTAPKKTPAKKAG